MSAKIISIGNNKGGVGKSTVAFNLVGELARRGQKVLAIDLDYRQANLTRALIANNAVASHESIEGVLKLQSAADKCILNTLVEGVHLIPSSKDAGLSGTLAQEAVNSPMKTPVQFRLKNALEKTGLSEHYDYIIVDSPASVDLITSLILIASNFVIIPINANIDDINGAIDYVEVIDAIRETGYSDVQTLGILRNVYEPNSRITKAIDDALNEYRKEGRQLQGVHVFDASIKKDTKLRELKAMSLTIAQKKSPSQINFRDLAYEIEERVALMHNNLQVKNQSQKGVAHV